MAVTFGNMSENWIAKLLYQYKPKSRRCQKRPAKSWNRFNLTLVNGTGQQRKE
jgi:hypothetical protein